MIAIPESGVDSPNYVNLFFEQSEAMVLYAPNGLLAEVAEHVDSDELTTFLGERNVIFCCDRALGYEIVSRSSRNSVEERLQLNLTAHFSLDH